MKLHSFASSFTPQFAATKIAAAQIAAAQISRWTGLIGLLWVVAPGWVAPAQAGQLTTWHYDANQNQFEFATDAGVQPRAQLVFDPVRLVIDLPGMQLDQPITQEIGGSVQRIRIGQFDDQTTRIVVELAPGYTLDPQQIRFRGLSPTQWMVQLPQPTVASSQSAASPPTRSASRPNESSTASLASSSASTLARPSSSQPASPANPTLLPLIGTAPPAIQASPSGRPLSQTAVQPTSPPARQTQSQARQTLASAQPATQPATQPPGPAQISAIQVIDQGLLITTQGANPPVSIDRSRSGRSITVRLANAQLAGGLRSGDREIDRHGVDEIEVSQDRSAVEIKLDVARRGPDWQATPQRSGLLLTPRSGATAEQPRDPVPPSGTARARTAAATAATSPAPLSGTAGITVAEQPSPARSTPPHSQLATVEGIELDLSGSRLLIQTDRPVAHQAQWQGGVYVLNLSPARLASRVSGPQLSSTDPLRRVTLRQTDDDTVTVSIQPATGIQFGNLNLVTPQTLALEMQRAPVARPTPSTGTTALPRLTPNGRIVVVLDPGHGGGDPGAVGRGDVHEADVVLPIAQQVATLLQQQGIQAVLTRSSDVEIDLEPRVQMAEQIQANLFVSIHANSMGMDRPDVNGTETYYYSSGAALAQTIQDSIISGVGTNDRGIKQARFYVLRKTSMPAVLVETGYVTGSEDAPRLANSDFQSQMAAAIARGILLYIQQQSITGSR